MCVVKRLINGNKYWFFQLLWAIKGLDRKWLQLQKRKTVLSSYYEKRYEEEICTIYDESRLNLNQQFFQSIIKSLEEADSEREINDVELKFNLHFPPGEVVDEGQFKRPKKNSLYSICSKAGLWEIASKFGPNAEQFGLHITLERVSKEVSDDLKESPEEVASNFTCALFESPEAVLKGARRMAATEISCEPCFRKHVRSIFMDKVEVSTCPTIEGNIAIDSFHQYARVKWLRNKPLSKFEDAQWLLIQKAEEEKLLNVNIKLPENIINKLRDEANVCYLSDSVSKSARLWNEQRKLILSEAFSEFLLPSMVKEVRNLLTTRAKSWLAMEYGKKLWSKVSCAPYRPKVNEVSPDEEIVPRVMACCWGSGKPPTTFVMLDSSGEVLDILSTGSLNIRVNNVVDEQRKRNDKQRLIKFMADYQPHVVVLGAANLYCTRLRDDIFEIIFKTLEENPRDVGEEMDSINIYYGDESLPRLYEHSRISSDQLPRQSGIVKRAVALGRFLQNPLTMVATLCGAEREIVSWKLNPLDHFLTSDEKYEMIEQIMVDVTNQVGFDINMAINHDWLFAPLQFVSGIGPRKAISIQRALVKAGVVCTRKELTEHGLSTKKIFINAVGFLRVRSSGKMAYNADIDILDDTRIHPESYRDAEFLSKTVYMHYNDRGDDEELAVEYVRNNQAQLKSFDIDRYASDSGLINKRETLRGIVLELLHGFQDWRKPYEVLSQDELLYMVSGENDYSLAEGRTVLVTVRNIKFERAFCVLESGLTGILSKQDFTTDGNDFDLLHEGFTLSCKIKSVEKNRCQVFLTCNERQFKRHTDQIQDVDPYYHEDTSSLLCQKDKVPKGKAPTENQLKHRMIIHPHFQNMTEVEAIQDVGRSVIHPSSRGPYYLTLSLKVYDGVYAHKDITEGGKDHTGVTSLLRIGKTLKIGDESFEDLDEVMDRYVEPLANHLKKMLKYRKFRRGTRAEVDELLRVEKSDNPKKIVYSFGVSHNHPGSFILTYIRSENPHHEYVGLYPKGFKFRKRMFDNIDRLVAYFQQHIDDLQHVSTPSVRSVSAMVPIRSPDFRGTAGGGNGDASGFPKPYGGRGRPSGDDNDRESVPSGWTSKSSGGARVGSWGSASTDGNGNSGKWTGGSNSGWGGKMADGSADGDNHGVSGRGWGGSGGDKGGSHSLGRDDGWKNFLGTKVQNSPGREAFPGGWGSGGSGSAGGWGSRDAGGGGNWSGIHGGWTSGGSEHDSGNGHGHGHVQGHGCRRGRGRGGGNCSSSGGGWIAGSSEHGGGGGGGNRGRGRGHGFNSGRVGRIINERVDSSNSKWGSDSGKKHGSGWSSTGGGWSSGGWGGNAGGGNNTGSTWGASNSDTSSGGWGGRTGVETAGNRSEGGANTCDSGWGCKSGWGGGGVETSDSGWGAKSGRNSGSNWGRDGGGGGGDARCVSGWAGNNESKNKGSSGWGSW
ncbi:hypothetical protein LguiB_024070 [Lonicera macranthoides]